MKTCVYRGTWVFGANAHSWQTNHALAWQAGCENRASGHGPHEGRYGRLAAVSEGAVLGRSGRIRRRLLLRRCATGGRVRDAGGAASAPAATLRMLIAPYPCKTYEIDRSLQDAITMSRPRFISARGGLSASGRRRSSVRAVMSIVASEFSDSASRARVSPSNVRSASESA